MKRFLRFILTEILPLVIIALIILIFTILPYRSTKAELRRNAEINVYQCKFENIVRDFMLTASSARTKKTVLLVDGRRVVVTIPKNGVIAEKYKDYADAIKNLPSPC